MDEAKEEEVKPKNKGGRPRKKVWLNPRTKRPPKLTGIRFEARSRIAKAAAANPETRKKKLAALAKAT